jgi:hypothetical protein
MKTPDICDYGFGILKSSFIFTIRNSNPRIITMVRNCTKNIVYRHRIVIGNMITSSGIHILRSLKIENK